MTKNQISVCKNGDEVNSEVQGRKVLSVFPARCFEEDNVPQYIVDKVNVTDVVTKAQVVIIFDDF